jgi:hypothetical protein
LEQRLPERMRNLGKIVRLEKSDEFKRCIRENPDEHQMCRDTANKNWRHADDTAQGAPLRKRLTVLVHPRSHLSHKASNCGENVLRFIVNVFTFDVHYRIACSRPHGIQRCIDLIEELLIRRIAPSGCGAPNQFILNVPKYCPPRLVAIFDRVRDTQAFCYGIDPSL